MMRYIKLVSGVALIVADVPLTLAFAREMHPPAALALFLVVVLIFACAMILILTAREDGRNLRRHSPLTCQIHRRPYGGRRRQ